MDESGDIVKQKFFDFITGFTADAVEVDAENTTTQIRLMSDYRGQISHIIQNDKSTLFVNYQHVLDFDFELAEAIEMEYYRFDPFLRKALMEYINLNHREYGHDPNKGNHRDYFVALHAMPRVERIRNMRTDRIGRLICISGTVTRSSDVRPELLFGNFTCRKCGTGHPQVEQQFQYTEPQVCRNSECTSRDFNLVVQDSTFVDWQRLRVQENADEIPPGSMPRCIDVICRNDVVEKAKAGDKILFTGTVIVVPDSSGLSRVGESTTSSKTTGGRGSDVGGGFQGLSKMGCKEMTYKMLFIACSVQQTDNTMVGNAGNLGGSAMGQVYTPFANEEQGNDGDKDGAPELSDAEKHEILQMRNAGVISLKSVTIN